VLAPVGAVAALIGAKAASVESAPATDGSSGNYMCIIMSFNFKRHNNTYKILKRHNHIFKNCMTFICHTF